MNSQCVDSLVLSAIATDFAIYTRTARVVRSSPLYLELRTSVVGLVVSAVLSHNPCYRCTLVLCPLFLDSDTPNPS